MQNSEWYRSIHSRLIDEDPTAPAELVQNILGPLVQTLTRKYCYIPDPDLVGDAVTDALIAYIKNPNQFDPQKRGLFGYLKMAAEGDLKNALARARRICEREISTEDVELLISDGNIGEEAKADEVYQHREEASELRRMLRTVFHDGVDRRAAELILEGERSTEKFVELYGLENMTSAEQRREVKRQKDRIKKRIERRVKDRHEG